MLQLDVWNIVFTVINVLILFILLRIFLFKPVNKMIAARQEEADKLLDETMQKQKAADDLKEKYETVLSDTEAEKKKVIQEAIKSADSEYQRIVGIAKGDADRIRKDAIAEANKEKNNIIKSVEKEIADMVVDAAAKISADNSSNSKIYDAFLDKAGDKK